VNFERVENRKMINALDLKTNKKYYKKEICEQILNEIELEIIRVDTIVGHGFETNEYSMYIEEKRGYWGAKGDFKTGLSSNDIEYIEKVLKESNFKVDPIRYKDTNTIKWFIHWDNLVFINIIN